MFEEVFLKKEFIVTKFSHKTVALEAEIQVKLKDMRTVLKRLQKYGFNGAEGGQKIGGEPVTITEVVNTDLDSSETQQCTA